jgi:hypothetical protein
MRIFAALLVCTLAAGPAGLSARDQDAKSVAAAKQLTEALDQMKLDAIAAPDPADPETFVAALYFQGAQLLVVSAKYSAPTLLVDKIGKKDYRDVYIDLNSASVQGSKVFIMDQGANGLVAKPDDDEPADSWEQGNKAIAFDGDWKKQKISEDDYMKRFTSADDRYVQILNALAAAAKKNSGSESSGSSR